MIRSKYIFSRMPYAASCWQRSSLNRVASIRERCWPGARTSVFIQEQSWRSSCFSVKSQQYPQRPVWCSWGRVSVPPDVHSHGRWIYKTARCIAVLLLWISSWNLELWRSTPTEENSCDVVCCCDSVFLWTSSLIPYSVFAAAHLKTRSGATRLCWCRPQPALGHRPPSTNALFSSMYPTCSQRCIACRRQKKPNEWAGSITNVKRKDAGYLLLSRFQGDAD